MILREPCLPPGWYPRQKDAVEEFLAPYGKKSRSRGSAAFARAAIAPHAGWHYSGAAAAAAISSLDPEAETVAVVGGHLPRAMPVLAAKEEGIKTPLGTLKFDTELLEEFEKLIPCRPDRYADNTVEVQLPMIRYFFPNAEILWLRFPSDNSSFEAGKLLAKSAALLGRKLAVLASTDLTHYGENYGFSPKGRGRAALEWMSEVNDAAFIDAVLAGDPGLVLSRAENDRSACSAGAVLGALGFVSAAERGAALIEYRTSVDAGRLKPRRAGEIPDDEIPDSFVGYAAVSFGGT